MHRPQKSQKNINNAVLDAAKNGNLDKLIQSIDKGGDVNAMDHHSFTPLILAAIGDHVDCVRVLLERGASENLPSGTMKINAIHWAAYKRSFKCLTFFWIMSDHDYIHSYSSNILNARIYMVIPCCIMHRNQIQKHASIYY